LVRIARETLGAASEPVVEIVRHAPDDKNGLTAALNRCRKLVKMSIDKHKAGVLDEKCSAILDKL
jgi:hypothetical protein